MSEVSLKTDIDNLLENLSTSDRLLQLDAMLIQGEQVECPLEQQFVPGMWIRERAVPTETLFTTFTWKISHPFYCSMGELLIWDEKKGWQYFKAPCRGLTLSGTKRVVYAITDVVWTTFHPASFIKGDEDNLPEKAKNKLIKKLENIWLEKYQNSYLHLDEIKS